MARDFSLTPNSDNSRYFLRREGEQGSMEFVSFRMALAYARTCAESVGSKVVLFDCFGQEMMSFPARLPGKNFATMMEAKSGK